MKERDISIIGKGEKMHMSVRTVALSERQK